MKSDYKYLLSSGPDMSHLIDVRPFARLCEAEYTAKNLPDGRAWKIERADTLTAYSGINYRQIYDSKQYAKRLADERRKAYCEKRGYKFTTK